MTSIRKAGHSTWLIGVVAALAIVALSLALFIGGRQIKNNHEQARVNHSLIQRLDEQQRNLRAVLQKEQADRRCVERWIIARNTRDEIVRSYYIPRVALGIKITEARYRGDSQARIQHLRLIQLVVNKRYLRALRHNPYPPFKCANRRPIHIGQQPLPKVPQPGNGVPQQPVRTTPGSRPSRTPSPTPSTNYGGKTPPGHNKTPTAPTSAGSPLNLCSLAPLPVVCPSGVQLSAILNTGHTRRLYDYQMDVRSKSRRPQRVTRQRAVSYVPGRVLARQRG